MGELVIAVIVSRKCAVLKFLIYDAYEKYAKSVIVIKYPIGDISLDNPKIRNTNARFSKNGTTTATPVIINNGYLRKFFVIYLYKIK